MLSFDVHIKLATIKWGNFDQFWRFLAFNDMTSHKENSFPVDHNTLPLIHQIKYFDDVIKVSLLNTFKRTNEQNYPILWGNFITH